MVKILIVEDEQAIANLILMNLQASAMTCGRRSGKLARRENPGGPCDYRVMVSVALSRIYPLSPAGQTA